MEIEKKDAVFFIQKGNGCFLQVWQTVKRAFREFLSIPTLIIIGFLLLAICSNVIDREHIMWLKPVRAFMKTNIFNDVKATSDLLGAIASGIITVTSLTITLLLIVVQQTAASMSSQVFDQFLRSRHNQIYFGFFVGLSFYSLILLASVSETFNPVIGATLAFILTVIALYLLIILIYTTINDMRPEVIIDAIYNHIVTAREKQISFIQKTRHTACFNGPCRVSIKIMSHGYITSIDCAQIDGAIKKMHAEAEVVLLVSIGDFVAFRDEIGFVTATTVEDGEKVSYAVGEAIQIEQQRNISSDPANGIEELEMIAWTSISTAKSYPSPGLLTIRNLRDLLLRWSVVDSEPDKNLYPIVYQDNVVSRLMDTFETLAVISSESMQHQNFIEVIHTFTSVFNRLSPENKIRTEDIILRILSAMGDHVLTGPLETELNELTGMLVKASRIETANAVETAKNQLKLSVAKLNSRSTRVLK